MTTPTSTPPHWIRRWLPTAGVISALLAVPSALVCVFQLREMRQENERSENTLVEMRRVAASNEQQVAMLHSLVAATEAQAQTAVKATQQQASIAGSMAQMAAVTQGNSRSKVTIVDWQVHDFEAGKTPLWSISLKNAGRPATFRMSQSQQLLKSSSELPQVTPCNSQPSDILDVASVTTREGQILNNDYVANVSAKKWSLFVQGEICYKDTFDKHEYKFRYCLEYRPDYTRFCPTGNTSD